MAGWVCLSYRQNASMETSSSLHGVIFKKKQLCYVGLYKQLFKLDLHFPNFPCTKNHRANIFHGNVATPISSISSNKDADVYVKSLFEELDRLSSSNSLTQCPTSIELANKVNGALQMLLIQLQYGLNVSFEKNFKNVVISGFENGVSHMVALRRIAIDQFITSKHTLPEHVLLNVVKRKTTLQRQVQVFVDILDQLQVFYSNLNSIDQLCYVVFPTHIDTKTTFRVFKYNQKVFIKVTLFPFEPTAKEISFIGPTKEVAELRAMYDEKQYDWDPECNVYINLLRIFDVIAFPMRPTEASENSNNNDKCGVCMIERDEENTIPIISCDNAKCTLIFHASCLKEWFATQRESKQFFDISIGRCPYCNYKISCSFDDIFSS